MPGPSGYRRVGWGASPHLQGLGAVAWGRFRINVLCGSPRMPHRRVKTLEGKELAIFKDDRGDVRVGDARVTTADVDASNGVVHIIDHVLLPLVAAAPVAKNIVELAAGTPDLSTLVTALKAGKLTDALSGKGPFTVFAPSNEAFAKLPKSVLDRLLDPNNIKELQDVLEYHVIAGAAVHKADLKSIQNLGGGLVLKIKRNHATTPQPVYPIV